MSEIINKDKNYRVKSEYGTYKFNNRKTAEDLNQVLNNYELISKQYLKTEEILDSVQRKVIQLQMSLSILQDDLDKLKRDVGL